ncbi:MAG: hypothetical protein JSU03_04635 [Bacteroidetes bacterium]|nr:hypothetical protein [Bacteroidota bacterium]
MKKLYLMIFSLVLITGAISAATITSNAVTGNWNSTSSWAGGVIPGAGDDVIIADGAIITVNSAGAVANTIIIGGGTSGQLVIASWGNLSTFGVLGANQSVQVSAGATLLVNAGTLNIGNSANQRLDYTTGSKITINGGTVNLASRMTSSTTNGIIYTQTGGTFNVNTMGNGSGGFASFDIRNSDNSTFNMSGGSIVLQNAGTSGSGPRDYNNNPMNQNITGGTIQVGNASSSSAQTFYLQGVAPNLVVSNNVPGHTASLLGNLSVLFDININSGSTLTLDDGAGNGYLLNLTGTNLINNGTLNGTVSGSSLNFFGTTPQTYSGSGTLTSPLAQLGVDFGGGVTLNPSLPINFTVSTLVMNFGDITTGPSTLEIGTSPTNTGTLNYTFGTVIGKLKRWIATATGTTTFPVGIAGTTRSASINFTSAPTTGGSLTAEWINVPSGSNGLPLTEAAVPVTITNASSAGFWRVTAADGIAGYTYTGSFTGSAITTINDYTKLVLLKRVNASSPWTLSGTHITTTGSNFNPVLSRSGLTAFSDFGVGGDATTNILPITIEYLNGNKTSDGNLLNWKISCTNAPSATMTLERSADGRNFKPIKVISATAAQCAQPFSYTDLSALSGINYYRLKSTDPDGVSKYSNTIAILNKNKGFELVSLLPNYVTTTAALNVTSAVDTKMEISIIDISGKQVSRQTMNLATGNNVIQLNLSNLAAGTYRIVGLGADGQKKSLPFVKQ